MERPSVKQLNEVREELARLDADLKKHQKGYRNLKVGGSIPVVNLFAGSRALYTGKTGDWYQNRIEEIQDQKSSLLRMYGAYL